MAEFSPNLRILVVDDTSSIHEDFKKILGTTTADDLLEAREDALFKESLESRRAKELVFEISSADQGAAGVKRVAEAKAENRPYAMAFVDMRMPPGIDGVETIQQIWQKDPRLEIVICTAFADYSWQEIMECLGETDQLLILKKPYDYTEVRQLAASNTRKWALAEQTRA